MNYFAHGLRFLDEPYFLVGTAMPDMLSVIDRGVRLRERGIAPFLNDDDPRMAAFAAGTRQHLHDDRWFHKTRAFFEVTGEMAALFRRHVDGDDRFRASFLGHIVTELLLDAVLHAEHPGQLDRYYDAFATVDTSFIQASVNRMARGESNRIGSFVGLFGQERFLYDYTHPDRLLYRLNQVMRRVKLPPLPVSAYAVFEEGRELVHVQRHDLLPVEQFHWPPQNGV